MSFRSIFCYIWFLSQTPETALEWKNWKEYLLLFNHAWVHVNEVTFGKFLRVRGWFPGESTVRLESWNFQPYPLTFWEGKNGLEVELITNSNDLINRVYVMKPQQKNPNPRGSENFQVGEHIEVLGGWCSRRRHGSSVPLPTYLVLYISSARLFLNCIIYNKSAVVSKLCPWIL